LIATPHYAHTAIGIAALGAGYHASGYEGGFSIEPHLSVVYHDESVTLPEEQRFNNYVEYGRRMERIIANIQKELASG